ncbi:hypothetical protein [Streptomyces sp. NPDC006446]|uniref:hypothetical protein n=1 Tax=Streptomyces sp. NPDC006446 TaxID=3154301 RepID=UPI0033A758FA
MSTATTGPQPGRTPDIRGNSTARARRNRLGFTPDAAAWCVIGRIPEPPEDVRQAAGALRTRPAFMRPTAMAGVVLAAPFMLIGLLLGLLATGVEALQALLATKEERAAARSERRAAKLRDRAVTEHGLDKTFDGDWSGAAGQLLLRWYGHSSHHQRLVALTEGRTVLAAPPKRVSNRRESLVQVVAEIPAEDAVIEDPLLGEHASDRLRIRFTDGSWLTLITEERRSELHMYLLRRSRTGGADAAMG